MGDLAKVGWQRMDALVQDHGADGVLHMICDRVADDMSLSDIARTEGVPYHVLWKWLSAENRMEGYRLALEARADKEVHETLAIADDAKPEDVNVRKLRVDTRKWAASKWDRNRFGDKVEVTHKAIPVLNIVTAVMELPQDEKVVEGVPLEIEEAVDASADII